MPVPKVTVTELLIPFDAPCHCSPIAAAVASFSAITGSPNNPLSASAKFIPVTLARFGSFVRMPSKFSGIGDGAVNATASMERAAGSWPRISPAIPPIIPVSPSGVTFSGTCRFVR